MRLLTCLLFTSITACADRAVDDVTVYGRVVPPYQTVQACRDAVQDGLFNCRPSIVLCPDGRYELLVTDIINEGTYAIDGDELRFTMTGAGDAPDAFVGTIGDDDTLASPDLPYSPWPRIDAAPYRDACETTPAPRS
jgi:hypothetical protein